MAQEDKQRYINEMQEFQKSVQFQTYLKNKRSNSDLDPCLTEYGKGLIDIEVYFSHKVIFLIFMPPQSGSI
jgi:hypothetical protein